MQVKIVRQTDELHKETWVIDLWSDHLSDSPTLNLVVHSVEIKPTKRHKWQQTDHWYRWATGKPYGQPVPEDVVTEARNSFAAAILASKVDVG